MKKYRFYIISDISCLIFVHKSMQSKFMDLSIIFVNQQSYTYYLQDTISKRLFANSILDLKFNAVWMRTQKQMSGDFVWLIKHNCPISTVIKLG